MKIDINVVDPIECQISVDHVRFIKSCLQFTSVYWQKDKKKSALAGRDIKKRKHPSSRNKIRFKKINTEKRYNKRKS